jgi:hypothetical protein
VEERHLQLVASAPGGRARPVSPRARLVIAPSAGLTAFVRAAADAGLPAPEAVRLCLERALVLVDVAALGLDPDAARYRIGLVAASARTRRALVPEHAEYVRALQLGRPVPPADASDGLAVVLAARLLTRALSVCPQTFRAEVVAEMIAWELAAALEGRTMGEWALRTLIASGAVG